jgi:ABC-type lipoprotein export system ATPase subunit
VGEVEILQLKLRLIEHSNHLSGGSQHLSFGEQSAFSVVLFMYKCIANNPNLIILDDPTSSFIKTKSSPFTDAAQTRGKKRKIY